MFKRFLGAVFTILICGTYSPLFAEDAYFNLTIDGREYKFTSDDFFTRYNSFGVNDHEFKVFAGKEDSPQIIVIIPSDMSVPVSIASGSKEAGSKIFQGSVSLQDYPNKGDIWNSYDGMANPKPEPVPDAVVITDIKQEGGTRLISGNVNTKTTGGHNLSAKFLIKHNF